jgi:hypothetical protein
MLRRLPQAGDVAGVDGSEHRAVCGARVKKLLADAMLDAAALKELLAKKW